MTGRELSRRVEAGDARAVPLAGKTDLSGFSVEANRCHENVAKWIVAHPGHRHVRGWLVTETTGGYVFDKHSVVGIGNDLLDVTPRRDQYARRFLLFAGT